MFTNKLYLPYPNPNVPTRPTHMYTISSTYHAPTPMLPPDPHTCTQQALPTMPLPQCYHQTHTHVYNKLYLPYPYPNVTTRPIHMYTISSTHHTPTQCYHQTHTHVYNKLYLPYPYPNVTTRPIRIYTISSTYHTPTTMLPPDPHTCLQQAPPTIPLPQCYHQTHTHIYNKLYLPYPYPNVTTKPIHMYTKSSTHHTPTPMLPPDPYTCTQ